MSKCDIQDCENYTVHYPKNMNKMSYEELVEIFNENMEGLTTFVRYAIFKNYKGEWPEIEVKRD